MCPGVREREGKFFLSATYVSSNKRPTFYVVVKFGLTVSYVVMGGFNINMTSEDSTTRQLEDLQRRHLAVIML